MGNFIINVIGIFLLMFLGVWIYNKLHPGAFDRKLEELFLGIQDGRYSGGRLGNYTDRPEEITAPVCAALDRMDAVIHAQTEVIPFALIPALMTAADIGENTK